MELRDLRFFCLTAELGSVTRAAEQLGVSQPFVTKVIHHLEEELGTQLFDIERRRIVLNENGSYFYREAREIVDRADRLTGNMAAKREQSKFTIQLLYNNAGYLSALNDAFMRQFPNAVLSETFARRNDIIELLNTGKADFAVALPPITGEESRMIETITVLKDTGSIMVPPDHPFYETRSIISSFKISPLTIDITKGSISFAAIFFASQV